MSHPTSRGRPLGRLLPRIAAPVTSVAALAVLAALAIAPTPEPEARALPVVDDDIRLVAQVSVGHVFEPKLEPKPEPWATPIPGGYRLTSTFGETGLWADAHTGLDFAAPEGTPVQSIGAGTVTEVGYDGAYGNKVVVAGDDGTEVSYCHLSVTEVAIGQPVAAGSAIGAVGTTGNVTGPHLHLETRPGGGEPADPYAFLAEHGVL